MNRGLVLGIKDRVLARCLYASRHNGGPGPEQGFQSMAAAQAPNKQVSIITCLCNAVESLVQIMLWGRGVES